MRRPPLIYRFLRGDVRLMTGVVLRETAAQGAAYRRQSPKHG